MKIIKFRPEDIAETKDLEDVFEVMLIKVSDNSDGIYDIHDKTIFGEKEHYRNLIMTDKTFNEIYEHLKPLGKKRRNRLGQPMPSGYAQQWCNYGPVTCGPRFEEVKEFAGGEIEDYALYLITPDDPIFGQAPTV